VRTGAVRLDRSVPLEDLIESLTAIAGVGSWTAHYIALRLGERDGCPITDLGLRSTIRARTGHSETAADVAGRWRPWRALAVAHLWRAASVERLPARQVDAA
jgi:AraC family transcriptional regulator of adaptative response / DNA-3-methyladenine glycosylase II